MTNYSDEPGHVRCDAFKESGKWYETFQIDMTELYNEPLIHDAVKTAVHVALKGRLIGMRMVVLLPYHTNEHPISFVYNGYSTFE